MNLLSQTESLVRRKSFRKCIHLDSELHRSLPHNKAAVGTFTHLLLVQCGRAGYVWLAQVYLGCPTRYPPPATRHPPREEDDNLQAFYRQMFDFPRAPSVDSPVRRRGAMRRLFALAICAMLATAGTARPDSLPLPTAMNILGVVTAAARPVAHALVIAFNLNTLEANQTFSGSDGIFALPLLPAAVYRIIAIKQGFAPTMTMVVPTQKNYRIALRLDSPGLPQCLALLLR